MFIFYNMAKFGHDEAAREAEFRFEKLNSDRVTSTLKDRMIRQYQAVTDHEESEDLCENDNFKELAEKYYFRSMILAQEEDRKARGKVNYARKQLEHDAEMFPDIAERETYRRNKDDLDAVDRDTSALQDENDRLRLKARQIKAHVQTAMRIEKEFPDVVYNPEWNRGK
jgi:hypothetical protein